MNKPIDLKKYLDAQELYYEDVITQLTLGNKTSDWIWYIFPQVKGLGGSHLSNLYAFKNRQEIEAYMNNSIIFARLKECTELVLNHSFMNIEDILPPPNNMKFISSMTAFMLCQRDEEIFRKALNIFNKGELCLKTIDFLSEDVDYAVYGSEP